MEGEKLLNQIGILLGLMRCLLQETSHECVLFVKDTCGYVMVKNVFHPLVHLKSLYNGRFGTRGKLGYIGD